MHLVESVGSDQRDGLTERAMGVLLGSSGTQPACFLRVFLGEQRRNRHGGEFLHEGDYYDDFELLCRNADACDLCLTHVGYWSVPGRPPGREGSVHHRLNPPDIALFGLSFSCRNAVIIQIGEKASPTYLDTLHANFASRAGAALAHCMITLRSELPPAVPPVTMSAPAARLAPTVLMPAASGVPHLPRAVLHFVVQVQLPFSCNNDGVGCIFVLRSL